MNYKKLSSVIDAFLKVNDSDTEVILGILSFDELVDKLSEVPYEQAINFEPDADMKADGPYVIADTIEQQLQESGIYDVVEIIITDNGRWTAKMHAE